MRERYSAPAKSRKPKTRNLRDFRDLLVAYCGYSRRQANWITACLEDRRDFDPQFCAFLLAIADRFGPDMREFEASDEEINAEARTLFEGGMLSIWDPPAGGPQ